MAERQVEKLIRCIFNIRTGVDFTDAALAVFRFQFRMNPVYHDFTTALGINPSDVTHVENIPFLPICFFRTQAILCAGKRATRTFLSSGTSGAERSRHPVVDVGLYRRSLLTGYRHFYGDPKQYRFLSLTPSPEEAPDSSLVFMIRELMQAAGQTGNEFYMGKPEKLHEILISPKSQVSSPKSQVPGAQCPVPSAQYPVPSTQCPVPSTSSFVIGLTYSLLDFAELFPCRYENTIFMETGGMKGTRQEMIREELHQILRERLGTKVIHSEYGMTELLSQAYSTEHGVFRTPPWMKVLIRETNDPLTYVNAGSAGGINIIDLANIYSCSFIATDDLGRLHPDGSFEVLGRFDETEVRGCSLMSGDF